MCGVAGPAQEMPTAHTEAMTKSGAYARAGLACAGVYRRFKRVLAQSGDLMLVLGCMLLLSVC
jgi:hypothetical protein